MYRVQSTVYSYELARRVVLTAGIQELKYKDYDWVDNLVSIHA